MGRAFDVIVFSGLSTQAGLSARARGLSRELVRLGHSVLLTERGLPGEKGLELPGLDHRVVPTERAPFAVGILWDLAYNLGVAARHRCGVALCLKPLPNAAIPALRLGRKGARTVIDVDDLDPQYYPDGPRRAASQALFRRYPRRFDAVTTHNRFLREVLLAECGVEPRRLLDLPQGIDVGRFGVERPDDTLRDRLGLRGRRVVAYLASLGMTSELDEVLSPLAEFVRGSSDRAVLVVGGGSRRAALEREARRVAGDGKVVFAGPVAHDDVPRHLALCEAGFNYMADTPANRCRASLKVREYMAAGLKVVCNPVGELSDLRELCYPFASIPEVGAALERAFADPGRERVDRARRWVEETCDWQRIVPSFLREVLEGGGLDGRR